MTAAEIKLDLFRKIDGLKDMELAAVYEKVLSLINPSNNYILTQPEKRAVEEALKYSKMGKTTSNEVVMSEAKSKYPQLKFK